jgi:hypothetical protein
MASAPQQDNQPHASHHAPKHESDERWKELCAQAVVEQDPERLMELVQELTRMLDEKEQMVRRARSANGHLAF